MDMERVIIEALREIGEPCRRSELAGVAQMTIRKLSIPLEALVERGLVRRLKDGRYTLRRRTLGRVQRAS